MPDEHNSPPADAAHPAAPATFYEASDAALARILGPNLQQATMRGVLYAAVAAVIFATIATLVR